MENTDMVIIDEIEYIIINRGNDEFTSMPKSVYDEQQAALKDK